MWISAPSRWKCCSVFSLVVFFVFPGECSGFRIASRGGTCKLIRMGISSASHDSFPFHIYTRVVIHLYSSLGPVGHRDRPEHDRGGTADLFSAPIPIYIYIYILYVSYPVDLSVTIKISSDRSVWSVECGQWCVSLPSLCFVIGFQVPMFLDIP